MAFSDHFENHSIIKDYCQPSMCCWISPNADTGLQIVHWHILRKKTKIHKKCLWSDKKNNGHFVNRSEHSISFQAIFWLHDNEIGIAYVSPNFTTCFKSMWFRNPYPCRNQQGVSIKTIAHNDSIIVAFHNVLGGSCLWFQVRIKTNCDRD